MADEALTFSELRKIQKQESRQDQLSDLDEKFLLRVSSYFDTKKDLEGDREYRNARRVFDKVVSLREDKIVKNAKLSLKSELDPSELNLLPREQELFRELKSVFRDHRNRLEKGLDGAEGSLEVEENKNQGEEDEGEEEYMELQITSHVPEFMGTDLETYGPFEEGEEVELPEENAEILVNRGSAEAAEK